MKWFVILVFVVNTIPVLSQSSLQDGDKCFDRGDYACAQIQYKQAMGLARGKDKQIAEIKLSQAKWCADHLKAANEAFDGKRYVDARGEYQKILENNPNDVHAKSQLEKCDIALKPAITLAVSPGTISFTHNGGNERVSVRTNAVDYSIDKFPAWCSVQKYTDYFVISCGANLVAEEKSENLTVSSGDKSFVVNVRQSGRPVKVETTLSVTKENLSFPATGGVSERIVVYSNATSYSTTLVPSWCSVRKYNGHFIVSCDLNDTPHARSSWFKVTVADKEVRVNVSQSAGVARSSTFTNRDPSLSVSDDNLTFPASGGMSGQINVYSNADAYSTTLLPPWCSVERYNGYFIVYCAVNNDAQPRSSWFKVTTRDKEVKVYVKQAGASRNRQGTMERRPKSGAPLDNSVGETIRCFNCPKSRDFWGLTAGYSQMVYGSIPSLEGVQVGIRLEPLFKWGFGLNTGIIWEGYAVDLRSAMEGEGIEKYSIGVPLHLEYRLNFSKWFNLFAYAGPSFRYFNDSAVSGYTLPTTLDYGGGFRISHIQFNIGRSFHAGDLKEISTIGKDASLYQNFLVSVSYVF